MNLEEFVKKHKTQSNAAKQLGVSQAMISSWLTNRYEITANTALFLEDRSNGEISRFDLLPDVFQINSIVVNE